MYGLRDGFCYDSDNRMATFYVENVRGFDFKATLYLDKVQREIEVPAP